MAQTHIDFAANRKALLTQLATFLEYQLNYGTIFGYGRKCMRPEQINRLPRAALAELFLSDQQVQASLGIEQAANPDSIIALAKEIDFRLPRTFLKLTEYPERLPDTWTINRTDLRYRFPENYDHEATYQEQVGADRIFRLKSRPATEKQQRYLLRLLDGTGYVLRCKIHELDASQVSALIDFFASDKVLPSEYQTLLEFE